MRSRATRRARRPALLLPHLLALACASSGLASCDRALPPEGQIVLFVSTDAPVGPRAPDGAWPLFDRLRVEVFPPDAISPCDGCKRDFTLDDDRMARGEASFGLFAPIGIRGYRARVRLFRSGGVPGAEPRFESTLEHVVALPPVPAEGIVEVSAILRVEDLAAPRGTLEAPTEPTLGRPPDGLVGSHPGARVVPCAAAPRDDEACIPGGMAWMGSPVLDVLDPYQAEGRNERLVVTSPFFVDLREVTVAEMRAARVARVLDDPQEKSLLWPDCVYTAEPGAGDGLPVNCLSWQRARAYCEKVGKRLPTEAEWEIAASGAEGRPFVWGSDPPACGDAVFERLSACTSGNRRVEPAGAGARDRLVVGDRTVLDLAGNVAELVHDRYEPAGGSCWRRGLLVDPVCESTVDDPAVPRTVRGGSWNDYGTLLRNAQRKFVENERFAVSATIGFRCARDGR